MAADSPSSPPERGAAVALVEITRDNLRDYLRLKVRPDGFEETGPMDGAERVLRRALVTGSLARTD